MGALAGRSLTFSEHLEELRGRLIICAITLVITTLVSVPYADDLLLLLARPLLSLTEVTPSQHLTVTIDPDGTWRAEVPPSLAGQTFALDEMPLLLQVQPASGEAFSVVYGRRPGSRLHYFSLTDPIVLLFKAALLLGLLLGMPMIGWQVWLFVAPGLTPRERSVAKPLIALLILSFPVGALFAYVLMHFAIVVLTSFALGEMVFLPDTARYVRFILTMMMAFGFVFEMPALVWILAKAGLVSAAWLARQRRFAIVGFFLLAAIVTPPDVFTQLAMAIPLVILYEVSIWLARLTERRASPTSKAS